MKDYYYALSPFVRVAKTSIGDSFYLERDIFDYELLFLKEGNLSVTVGNQTYEGKPNDVFLFKPKERHIIQTDGRIKQLVLHFDLIYEKNSHDVKVSFSKKENMTPAERQWFRDNLCSAPPFQLPNHIRLTNPQHLENIFHAIIREHTERMPYYEISVKGLFVQLWTMLLREYYWIENPQLRTSLGELSKVKTYLDCNLHENITVEQLADMINLSKYYLIRSFKNTFGVSPIKYHLMARIEKAKEYIFFTNMTITEIAEALGFQSIHSFSRAFKNIEGVSPLIYRKNGQKRLNKR